MSGSSSPIGDPRRETTRTHLHSYHANRRSRRVLEYLRGHEDTPVRLGDLVDQLTTDEPGSEQLDRLAIRLHHQILPQLADVGVIEYDPRDRTIQEVSSTRQ